MHKGGRLPLFIRDDQPALQLQMTTLVVGKIQGYGGVAVFGFSKEESWNKGGMENRIWKIQREASDHEARIKMGPAIWRGNSPQKAENFLTEVEGIDMDYSPKVALAR